MTEIINNSSDSPKLSIQEIVKAHRELPEWQLIDILSEIDKTSGLVKILYRAALSDESENSDDISLCDVHSPSDTYLLKICNDNLSELHKKISAIAKQLRDNRKEPDTSTSEN